MPHTRSSRAIFASVSLPFFFFHFFSLGRALNLAPCPTSFANLVRLFPPCHPRIDFRCKIHRWRDLMIVELRSNFIWFLIETLQQQREIERYELTRTWQLRLICAAALVELAHVSLDSTENDVINQIVISDFDVRSLNRCLFFYTKMPRSNKRKILTVKNTNFPWSINGNHWHLRIHRCSNYMDILSTGMIVAQSTRRPRIKMIGTVQFHYYKDVLKFSIAPQSNNSITLSCACEQSDEMKTTWL